VQVSKPGTPKISVLFQDSELIQGVHIGHTQNEVYVLSVSAFNIVQESNATDKQIINALCFKQVKEVNHGLQQSVFHHPCPPEIEYGSVQDNLRYIYGFWWGHCAHVEFTTLGASSKLASNCGENITKRLFYVALGKPELI
jgi:hypothetical protein